MTDKVQIIVNGVFCEPAEELVSKIAHESDTFALVLRIARDTAFRNLKDFQNGIVHIPQMPHISAHHITDAEMRNTAGPAPTGVYP